MITEDYVSFETAKLLRDKGFDAECRYYYIQTGEMFEIDTRFHTVLTTQELLNLQIVGEKEERCVAPTLQMAMKWLREVHDKNIILDMLPKNNDCYVLWTFNVISNKNYKIMWGIKQPKYNTYEKACEAAIKHCLENLI